MSKIIVTAAFFLLSFNLFSSDKPKNILFIGVDDLRPALHCYGDEQAITPAFDQLAKAGALFSNAYTQYPVCNPSRRSLLSGLRPQRFDFHKKLSETAPNHLSLPGYLKKNGYYTASIGKLYHGKGEDYGAWDYLDQVGPWQNYGNPDNYDKKPMPVTEAEDRPDSDYTDGQATLTAIKKLKEVKDKPFFIGVGYRKPHLPFAAPKKYWDLYDEDNLNIIGNTSVPDDAPGIVYHWSEMNAYTPSGFEGNDDDLRNIGINIETLKTLTHGYYACVSFIDAQISKLLSELKKLELDRNTIVVIWSDHGFHLGQQHIVGKHTCYENSCRVPLIIYNPENPGEGVTCSSLVELVDLFPTLTDLCGLPPPPVYDGKSLVPLLNQPEDKIRDYAFTAYNPHAESVHDIVGVSLRDRKFRYTKWYNKNNGETAARELYKLKDNLGEKVNVSNNQKYKHKVAAYEAVVDDSIKSWSATKPSMVTEVSESHSGEGELNAPVREGSLYPPSDLVVPYHGEWTKKHYPERIKFFKENPLEYNDVVFLGNSITERGGDWSKRFGIPHLKNRGIKGDVTDGVLQRLDEIIYYKPKAVFLLIGINDLYNLNNKKEIPSAEYVGNNILKIAKTIKEGSPETRIYIQTVLPTSNDFMKTDIIKVNAMIKNNCANGIYEVIDLHPIFTNERGLIMEDLSNDGTHPNEKGYARWINFLKPVLGKL